MTTYTATTTEAANLANGTMKMIVSRMKRQPMYDKKNIESSTICEMMKVYTPYPPGTIIAVRETWQHTDCLNINREDENSGYIYAATENGQDFQNNIEHWSWRSPVTMPRSAARTHLVAGKTVCVRVQDMCDDIGMVEALCLWSRNMIAVMHNVSIYITAKFGQSCWDNNEYIFITQIEKK